MHAHFDHIGGAGAIADVLNPFVPGLRFIPMTMSSWRAGGGGAIFGYDIDPGPEPTIDFLHGMKLRLGSNSFEVRYTPGHTKGHCVLYAPDEGVCFCGDLIFQGSVGRTDLPWAVIRTRSRTASAPRFSPVLLSGHGPQTTVGDDKELILL